MDKSYCLGMLIIVFLRIETIKIIINIIIIIIIIIIISLLFIIADFKKYIFTTTSRL